MQLRHRFLSKVFAVWFVVMIVLPFTPPFQAYSPDMPFGKPTTSDLKASDKLSQDATVAALTPSAAALVACPISRSFAPARDAGPAHIAVHTVLRL